MRLVTLLLWVALGGIAAGQEYPISTPGEPAPAPVYLTEPVVGRVEVTNPPPVQEVLVVGGALDQPLEVQGEVGLRVVEPLPVTLVDVPPMPQLSLDGPVSVTAEQPLRVWVENPAPSLPPPVPVQPRYTAYAFAGNFEAQQSVQRRSFAPPAGTQFLLTDLTLDTRPDAVLYVRVLARPEDLAGDVAGAGDGELAFVVLDPRSGTAVHPGTPVPLGGPFVIEVTSAGLGRGAPFTVLAAGTLQAMSAAP